MISVVGVQREIRPARMIGALLLAVPLVTWVAASFFPSYDARARYFSGRERCGHLGGNG